MTDSIDGAPSARYHEGVIAHRWESDPAQLAVLPEFDRMHAALTAAPVETGLFGRLKNLLGNESPAPVPGLYLWGSVGRGKTFLMDLFVASLPAGLALGDEVELRDPGSATGAIAKCRRQDLDSEEIKEHLRNGKQVFQLGLVFDDRMSFVLGEDLIVRKLKFLDVVLDEMGDSHQDAAAEADASFALLTLEIERLLAKLEEWFGLPRPADA